MEQQVAQLQQQLEQLQVEFQQSAISLREQRPRAQMSGAFQAMRNLSVLTRPSQEHKRGHEIHRRSFTAHADRSHGF
eukprot:955934-Amphidinium_carterae.2